MLTFSFLLLFSIPFTCCFIFHLLWGPYEKKNIFQPYWRDSERLTDSSKVSKQTIGWAGIWEWPCPAPKYLVPSTEKNCPCFISQHTLGIIIGTRSWQTWAYFQLLLLHLIPTSTYARGNACLFLQFTKKVGKKMIHELISAKQMESLGEKGSVQGPRNKWGNP